MYTLETIMALGDVRSESYRMSYIKLLREQGQSITAIRRAVRIWDSVDRAMGVTQYEDRYYETLWDRQNYDEQAYYEDQRQEQLDQRIERKRRQHGLMPRLLLWHDPLLSWELLYSPAPLKAGQRVDGTCKDCGKASARCDCDLPF